jgi:1-acyl-sn-glycerol-3-phosphate acyltransferase
MIIRATLFNLYYYGITAILCFAYLPLLLLPRPAFVSMVKFWLSLVYIGEKYIMGLDYEIRGREYIPQDGAFLVAAKHQSAYETQKLHLILKDPAIILKKELLSIPIWGWYARKAEMIAIDRSTPKTALSSIIEGAKKIQKQNRPIVIFPQGTRVHPDQTTLEKPYKSGLAKMYEATNMPVLPLALNSGLFWPKNSFFKKPGTVILEFLPPMPTGQDPKEMMHSLETNLENASNALKEEQGQKKTMIKRFAVSFIFIWALTIISYTGLWFFVKTLINNEIDQIYKNADYQGYVLVGKRPTITGFPGPYDIHWTGIIYGPEQLRLEVPHLNIHGFPVPTRPISVELTKGLIIEQKGIVEKIDHFLLDFIVPKDFPSPITEKKIQQWQKNGGKIDINHLDVSKDLIKIKGYGAFFLDENLQIAANLQYKIYGFERLLSTLKEQNNLSGLQLMLAYKLTNTLSQIDPVTSEKFVKIPVTIQNRNLYLGPVLAAHLNAIRWPNDNPPDGHQQ